MHRHFWNIKLRWYQEACASTYDTSEFIASELCVSCGGGQQSSCSLEVYSMRERMLSFRNFPQELYHTLRHFAAANCADCTDFLPLSNVSEIVLTDPTKNIIQIENNEALVSLQESSIFSKMNFTVTSRFVRIVYFPPFRSSQIFTRFEVTSLSRTIRNFLV